MPNKKSSGEQTRASCPIMFALETLGKKWFIPIICELNRHDTVRYNALAKMIPGINGVMLAQSLKELCTLGFANRVQYNEVPLRVEYSLTDIGKSIIPSLLKLTNWSIDMMLESGLDVTCHDSTCLAMVEHNLVINQSHIDAYREKWDAEYDRLAKNPELQGLDPIDKLCAWFLDSLQLSQEYGEELSRMATLYYIVGEEKSHELLSEERVTVKAINELLDEARQMDILRDDLSNDEIVHAYLSFRHGLNSYWELERCAYNIVDKNWAVISWFCNSLRK